MSATATLDPEVETIDINALASSDETPVDEINAALSELSFDVAASPRGGMYIVTAPSSTWYLALVAAGQQGLGRFRSNTARAIAKKYPEISDPAGSDQLVTIEIKNDAAYHMRGLQDAVGFAMNSVEYTEELQEAASPRRVRSRTSKNRTPRECECGCGGMTGGGRFIPGHDSKMKSRLLGEYDEGSAEAGATLIEKGWYTQEQLDGRAAKAAAKEAARLEREVAREQAREERAAAKAARRASSEEDDTTPDSDEE